MQDWAELCVGRGNLAVGDAPDTETGLLRFCITFVSIMLHRVAWGVSGLPTGRRFGHLVRLAVRMAWRVIPLDCEWLGWGEFSCSPGIVQRGRPEPCPPAERFGFARQLFLWLACGATREAEPYPGFQAKVIFQTSSMRKSRPMALAARDRVCNVTEALPGSRRRSSAARLVFMRRAISTLLILSFSIAC